MRRLGFVTAYFAIAGALTVPLGVIAARDPAAPKWLFFAVKAVVLLVPPLVVGRGPSLLGLAPRVTLRALLVAVAYCALIAALATLQNGSLPKLAAPTALVVLHVLVEEMAARGFVLGVLSQDRAFWKANAWQTVLFVGVHVPAFYALGARAEIVVMVLVLGVLSLVLGVLTRLSGSIWLAVVVHLLNNLLAS